MAFVPFQGAGLVAVDLQTGTPQWVAPTPGATGTTTPLPMPGGDVAYAANGLARFDGRSGAEVWRLGGDLRDAVAYSRLALADGVLLATLVAPDAAAANGERTVAVAVAADTGRVLWQRDLDGLAVGVPPAAGDGVAVVVDGANVASVLDLATGEVRWTTGLHSVPAGPPSVHDGVVTLVEQGRAEDLTQRDFRIVAHDVASGAFVGGYEPPSANDVPLDTVAVGPDGLRLVPTTGAANQVVLLLEAHDG
jgi:outer membrane protein assembly factor BamB